MMVLFVNRVVKLVSVVYFEQDVFHRDLTLQLGVRIMDMQRLMVELTPDLELGGFTARVPDIPAYGEGSTEDEAMADLMQALTAYIEAFGLDDAVGRLNPPSSNP